MSYVYAEHRPFVFTEDGQIMFLRIRDKANRLLDLAGAVCFTKLVTGIGGGDTWKMLACVDRLVEIGDLIEVPNPVSRAGQYRLFISPRMGLAA